jgi:transposase
MAKLHTQNTAGSNAGSTFLSKMVRVSDIVIDPEIAGIFDISEKTLDKITERIKHFGFYKEEPVVIWKGTNTLVDGRTRYTAAKNAGLEEIPAVEREFESKEAAIHYTIERQVYRRNLTGAEILKVAKMLPEERNRKGDGNAARQLAEETGVSESTIYKANKILKEGSPEVVEKVESGEMSIKDGYQETVEKNPKTVGSKPLPGFESSSKKTPEQKKASDLSAYLFDALSNARSASVFVDSLNLEPDEEYKLRGFHLETMRSLENGLTIHMGNDWEETFNRLKNR